MNLTSDKSTKKPNTLSYNVRWMDRVFRSRATTEALLAPEREFGNLTPHDYDASLQFLPGYHRQYPILACLGASALLLLRKPTAKWTQRRALAAFTLGFTGYTFGKLSMLRAHYDYVRNLENPAGFEKAMENVQAKLGGLIPQGFVIERVYEPSPDDYSNQNESIILPAALDNSPTRQQTNQPSEQPPLSKWDQLRKLNDNTAKNSSWDALRQKHERSTSTVKSSNSDEELFWDDASSPDADTSRTEQ